VHSSKSFRLKRASKRAIFPFFYPWMATYRHSLTKKGNTNTNNMDTCEGLKGDYQRVENTAISGNNNNSNARVCKKRIVNRTDRERQVLYLLT